jgi:uncharacterized protein involved in exopolysaccharide biosynthesis
MRIVLVTLAAGVLGILLAVVLPKWYRATAVILPPEETDLGGNLGIMARALSKLPALGEFGEYSTPVDIYKAILKSRTVQDEIVERFGLMKIYRLRSRELTLKTLAKHSSVKMNPDGTISVSVEDKDPKRSAAMTMAMLEGLDHYNIAKRNTQGQRTRVFLQRRVAETDSALRVSEMSLRRYQEKHRAVAPASINSADVSAAADLMARKVALEVRIGIMRGYMRENNEQVIQAQRELAELERQIGTLPGLQTELARLIRDNKVQEQLYLLLTAELEDARVKELRDTPTVTILDAPTVPERPSRPRKLYFGLVAALLGFVGSCAMVVVREPVTVIRRD